MTTDAIKRVKDAEIEAKQIVDSANDTANFLKQETENECKRIFNDSLKEAKKKATNIKFSLINEGEMLLKPIIEKTHQQISLIESIEKSKLESVVNSIVERIVSIYGNS